MYFSTGKIEFLNEHSRHVEDAATYIQPVNLDHPGTPVQELGAAVILGKWLGGNLFGAWMPLEESVITHAGEFARLAGAPPGHDRVGACRRLADTFGATIASAMRTSCRVSQPFLSASIQIRKRVRR